MTNNAEKISPPLFTVRHNGDLLISVGRSRYETAWKNKTMSWAVLLNKLAHSVETTETHAEYMKMSKEQQDRIKDIGGFVGGHLKDGRRKTGFVSARQLLTLDLDFPPADFWDSIINNLEINSALAVYSTHKHTAAKPRYRLIMPLDREVTPDEYEAIARKIAEKIGIDYFDDSTFQPTRLMYWPSHSVDVEPFFRYYDAPFLSASAVLDEYPDWTDTSYWPESSRMAGIRKREADKQGDPLAKKGVLGAFCRTYTITQAIAKFLPDIYTETAKEDRYTYAAGSTAAGLVVYDGDVFAYSTMHIVVGSYNDGGTVGIGATDASGSYNESVSITSAKEYTIDVSDINGEYYVKLASTGKQNNSNYYVSIGFSVSKIWLE